MDTVETTDHELMLAVRAGEIARLGDLFERYHQPLYGFFVRLTGQRTASEDLVQLVFYRILKYRHTYRDEGKFSAWIYHLARKVAADHFRKNAHTPVLLDEADDRPAVRDGVLASLPREGSPLVQLAMIDFLTSLRDKQAAPAFEALTRNTAIDKSVRDAAQRALVQL